ADEDALRAGHAEALAGVIEDAPRRLAPADVAAQHDGVDAARDAEPFELLAPRGGRAAPGEIRHDGRSIAVRAQQVQSRVRVVVRAADLEDRPEKRLA